MFYQSKFVLSALGVLTMLTSLSCNRNPRLRMDFSHTNPRIWLDEKLWAIPLEDWQINEGRIEARASRPNMRVNILSHDLQGLGDFYFSVQMGEMNSNKGPVSGGIRLALKDDTDNDYRSVCYFGTGIDIGINKDKQFFIGEETVEIPEDFDFSSFVLQVKGNITAGTKSLSASVTDASGANASLSSDDFSDFDGLISLVNNFPGQGTQNSDNGFWFNNINLNGSLVKEHPDRVFGPVLWTMYTLNDGKLKMTAQMPPLGEKYTEKVHLQVLKDEEWTEVSASPIDKDSRIAVFSVDEWDVSSNSPYRLGYRLDGDMHYYKGEIRKEPDSTSMEVAAMTCQYHYGFPYRPLAENLEKLNPDLLYFSGDQIYEANGGYGIIRFPAEEAILNYLGKWYMFGWAFGDLLKNRPSVVIPDDHEVYQGNLWGDGGTKTEAETWNASADCISGFVQPPEMVNVVIHTHTSHMPDPYDPDPMKQGIDVYYTDLSYGGLSFAVVGDRIFKSGPENVADWEGRKDHINRKIDDPSVLDKENLKFLGDRQLDFLQHWVEDWDKAEMKVLLSQTVFANAATHHGGERQFLYGDMDSGGWPKSGRDKAIEIIRKAFAFHICGDQHLPSFVQYGTDEFRDAGWAFCTPAITVGYQRRFLPDQLGWEINNRPAHELPNTGYYRDIFGNPNYVYAVGNPDDVATDPNRYEQAQLRASGFGYIEFDLAERTITSSAYKFLSDPASTNENNQFPGWPVKIKQTDNYGKTPAFFLPTLYFEKPEKPLIKLFNKNTGELVYSLRIRDKYFDAFVFENAAYILEYQSHDDTGFKTLNIDQLYAKAGQDTLIIQ